jgi:hypothetical protein
VSLAADRVIRQEIVPWSHVPSQCERGQVPLLELRASTLFLLLFVPFFKVQRHTYPKHYRYAYARYNDISNHLISQSFVISEPSALFLLLLISFFEISRHPPPKENSHSDTCQNDISNHYSISQSFVISGPLALFLLSFRLPIVEIERQARTDHQCDRHCR